MFCFGLLIKDLYDRQEQTSAIMHYLLKDFLDISQVLLSHNTLYPYQHTKKTHCQPFYTLIYKLFIIPVKLLRHIMVY